MARAGIFDSTAVPAGWFDETASIAGWFDDDALSGNVYNESLTETVTLSAGQSATQVFTSLLAESVALADLDIPNAIYIAAISEAITPLDDYLSSLLTGGTTYNNSLNESVVLGFTLIATQTFAASIAESVALSENRQASLVANAALSETVALADAQSVQAIYGAQLGESISLSDAQQAAQIFSNTIGENVGLVFVVNGDIAGGFVWPDPSTVQAGVMYGPTGTEYTGTAAAGGTVFMRRR